MLNYAAAQNHEFPDAIQAYDERDSILYALGLGYGCDPLDEAELRFVYEKSLNVVPSQAATLGSPGFFWQDPALGVDWVKIVHGEEDIRWFQPFPTAATIIGRNRICSITDKGPGKGAVAEVVRELVDRDSGKVIAEERRVVFLRGDGGFSADDGISDPAPLPLPQIGEELGAPQRTVELSILSQAALIYRLSGDYNPLHADPATARAAGFERPILHGLCTYGMAARALLGTYLDHDTARLRRLAMRFTAPVFPGETLTFEFWQRSATDIAIRACVAARGVIVLDHGIAEIA